MTKKDDTIDLSFLRKVAPKQDWYLKIRPKVKKLVKTIEEDPSRKKQIKEQVLTEVETLLAEEKLFLGSKEPRLDQERQPIDTIIIHHTSSKPGITLKRLNAMHLINIYMPYFQNPTLKSERWFKGSPITSNHLINGKPVFYAYHWLVRMDGTTERLLPDSALTWHAGNWSVNCRSVAICLDNDYETTDPEDSIVVALANLIRRNYPSVKAVNIMGHRDVKLNGETSCPGTNFDEWKKKLIKLVEQRD